MSNFDRMLVLTQEPFVGYMPDDVRGLLKEPMLDVLLASLFACVANQISCLLWDLDEGDNWAEYSYLVWEQIEEERESLFSGNRLGNMKKFGHSWKEMAFAVLPDGGCGWILPRRMRADAEILQGTEMSPAS